MNKSSSKFNPENDARALKAAGCNEEAIIDIITKRSNEQRQEIFQKFKTMYRKDLISELICTLKGNAEDVIIALMIPRAHYYAVQLRNALFGTEINLKVIIEILVAIDDVEKKKVEEAYRNFYGHIFYVKEDTLGNDLKRASTSTWINDLLISLLRSKRKASVDTPEAIRDRVRRLRIGLRSGDTNDLSYVLFCHTMPVVSQILDAYEEEGQPFEYDVLEGDLSDIEREVLSSMMKWQRNPSLYMADCLFDSMIGNDADNTTLIRIVVTRSENDLNIISRYFQEKSGGTALSSAIQNHTSGSLQKFLLAVVNNHNICI